MDLRPATTRFPARPAPEPVGRRPLRRGLALVSVLWVLALLALIAASFTRTTRTEVQLARIQQDSATAEALADAAFQRAVLALFVGSVAPGAGFAAESDTVPVPQAEAVVEGDAVTSVVRRDGTPYVWRFEGAELSFAVQDEGGRIDLNRAQDELLRGLFLSAEWAEPDGTVARLAAGEAEALVDAVIDFRDPDDLKRLNGAEDPDYEAAGLTWGAKDAPFLAVSELRQVIGMTGPLFDAVAPALTVHGGRGIDPAVAPRAVLLALPETSAAEVEDYLAARAAAPPGAAPDFLPAAGFAARSRGRALSVRAGARLPGGAAFVRESVVTLGGGDPPYQVLEWGRGRAE